MKAITELSQMKEIELRIMKIVHNFCEDNNISYYLAYGTLLGAVRHNGFIPWDDDIDIWMFRKDYERFINLFPKYGMKYGLYIVGKNTSPRYYRNMIKVCDARTELDEYQYRFQDKFGVYIDIWPLDGTPNNYIKRSIHNFIYKISYAVLNSGIYKTEYFKGGYIQRAFRFIFNIWGINNVLQFQERCSKKYPVSKSVFIESCANKTRGFRYKDFKKRHLIRFEDARFYVPNGFDRILKSCYGDYMKLPPPNEQIPHHIQNTYWL